MVILPEFHTWLGCFYFTASILLDYVLYIFLEGRSPYATFINTLVAPAVFSSFKQWYFTVFGLILHLADEVSNISRMRCGGSDGVTGLRVHGSLIHPTDALETISLYICLLQLTQVIILFRCRNKTLIAFRKLLLSYADFYKHLLLFTDVSNTAVLSEWQEQ